MLFVPFRTLSCIPVNKFLVCSIRIFVSRSPFQEREAQRDPEWELQVAKWVEKAAGEPLLDVNDLWISLRSGIVLCNLINKIKPGTIPRFAKTKVRGTE
jgi:hypothetical protein